VREIGWSHNLMILEKRNDQQPRQFYVQLTHRIGWTKNVLIHQIKTRPTRKLCSTRPASTARAEPLREQARLVVKDEHTFDFVELAEEQSKRQLEQAILTHIESLLREMGGLFAFLGSQYRLAIGTAEYFILHPYARFA
jgi:predicted nuclease of restriction endonuclease-like (RecB) superfamily